MEHLAVKSPLTLQEFTDLFRQVLNLPALEFDSENESEWGAVELSGTEYNISKPYEEGTLQEWDGTTPYGCNFGITLSTSKEHPNAANMEESNPVVASVAQRLSNGLDIPVFYHRTWLGPGQNITRNKTFFPA